MAVVMILGGPMLIAIGVWTIAHPNGGYRAAGGAGSGLAPETRRGSGFVIVAVGVLMIAVGIAAALSPS